MISNIHCAAVCPPSPRIQFPTVLNSLQRPQSFASLVQKAVCYLASPSRRVDMPSSWEIPRLGMSVHDMLCADVRSDGRYRLLNCCHRAKLLHIPACSFFGFHLGFLFFCLLFFRPPFLPSVPVPFSQQHCAGSTFLFCIPPSLFLFLLFICQQAL